MTDWRASVSVMLAAGTLALSPVAAARLDLPDSETAVAMVRPALPARIAADCPSSDPCEFGTTWRACEALPVYREARDGAALLRSLKPMETFVAEGGEIELVAPGKIAVLGAVDPTLTGGLALAPSTILDAYGPLQRGRALYYDPGSGKGWSPPPASDSFWWDGKGRIIETPTIIWWVKAKLAEGASGWLRIKSTSDAQNFPMFEYTEVFEAWDIHLTRDDETPDCAGLFRLNERG